MPVHGFTTTVTVTADAEQPAADVPVMVYTVVAVGDTAAEPPEYVYVDAPLGVKVVLVPVQMVAPLTEMVGVGLTVTVNTALPVQVVILLVPATVYAVVAVGVKATPLLIPPLQV